MEEISGRNNSENATVTSMDKNNNNGYMKKKQFVAVELIIYRQNN